MHPIILLAFFLLTAVALAPVSYLASAPAVLHADAEPVATEPGSKGEIATPNHGPHPDSLAQRSTAETVATPNHDVRRAVPPFALNPVALRAEPEPAKPAAPAFARADTTLYAKDGARLRAAPDTAADVLAKLDADAPLRATARSTDGAWWRVSLADGRTGYVHRTAVTRDLVAKTKPPTPAPAVAAAIPQPAPSNRDPGLLGYVDQTIDWFADAAARGSPPTAIRTER